MMKGKENKRNVKKKKPQKKSKSKSQTSKKTGKKTGISKKSKKLVNNSSSAGNKKNKGNRFVKGRSGNPKGRPKGSKNKFSVKEMMIALEKEAKIQGEESTYAYVAKRFFADDHVLISMMKKLLADLKSVEQIIVSDTSDEDKRKRRAIQKALQERCKTEADKRSNGTVIL